MKQTGWRKPTPGLGVARLPDQAGDREGMSKSRAFVAVKRVGAHLGLKAAEMMLLDTLGAFSQPQDWHPGQTPIVWPSNARLMEQTGFSLSALKRHVRRLAEAGVIGFRDSPNGKRWGQRDARGGIVEAYGFDLSPLGARAMEFEALHADIEAERALRARLRRQITITRRELRARLTALVDDAVTGPWSRLTARLDALVQTIPTGRAPLPVLRCLLDDLLRLAARVEAALVPETTANPVESPRETVVETAETDPREAGNGPHIETTNELQIVTSMGKPRETDTAAILRACPQLRSWLSDMGDVPKSFDALHRQIAQLHPMIGVPDRQWQDTREALGVAQAVQAVALVFDKFCNGEIAQPAGYLRGMVRKAAFGQLHLDRSFAGRSRRVAA